MRLIILNKRTLIILVSLALVVLLILAFTLGRFRSKEVFNPDLFYQGTTEEKLVAFACNIDWGGEYLEEMLAILDINEIKITFFPTGRWAEKNEALLKLIYDKQHEIGNHGYNHLDYDKLDEANNYREIKTAHEIIEKIINDQPKYFAPPSGAFNEHTISAAKQLGYKVILWSIDTIDWREDSNKDVIYQRVIEKLHNGGIVLMHPTEET
ncbi:MAG TPA: polysaccharide deacetylase family protein, partial [Tissierellaceae bacterium]|nr:polysaccharide deacetylase family protein [Tissierellaceae bacterium]